MHLIRKKALGDSHQGSGGARNDGMVYERIIIFALGIASKPPTSLWVLFFISSPPCESLGLTTILILVTRRDPPANTRHTTGQLLVLIVN